MEPTLSTEVLLVEAAASGQRLDTYLRQRLPGVTVPQVAEWIRTGAVLIRGKKCQPLRRIHRGDEIVLRRPAPRAVAAPTVALAPIAVLHESEHLRGIDKPPGLAVEPELVQALAAQLKGWNVGGRAEPGVVHRLDRDTSGCLLVARTDLGVAHLEQAFEAGEIEKVYRVAVLGTPPPSGRIESPYGRDPAHPRRFTTHVRSARRAALRYLTLSTAGGVSVLEVRLETGRTHQIRVQLSESGWPVLGDAVYGTEASRTHARAPARQALHAIELGFPVPGGARVTVASPVPADLAVLQSP